MKCKRGVVLILDIRSAKIVKAFRRISDSMQCLKLHDKHLGICYIQACASKTDSTE